MKFLLSSLKEFLETTASVEEICSRLTSIGLEVESLEDNARILSPFSVAKIVESKPHENSSKLKICLVETIDSNTPLQIVCGAANARAGIKVAYAPIGSTIPANQMVIKKAKIAGVESNGMLCSARELCLGDEDSGIIEIDEKWPVGTKISEVYSLNDALIEINVTPNRGDCLGVYGIARDLAASGIGVLKELVIKESATSFAFPFEVKNEALLVCNFALFRQIKNLKNCESPKWLKDKLVGIGMNPISAIVDVTNYVMHVLNRPMHAYDSSKINGSINIRFAKEKEKFTSLKSEEYELDEKILTIADQQKVIGVAGVIGSTNSSCDLETTSIVLESAFFAPSSVAYSGRKLNILSEARHRFERGVDQASCQQGIDLATQIILEICGGEVSEVKVVGQMTHPKKINFDSARIKKLTGVEIESSELFKILSSLGFKGSDLIEVPSHRHDIFSSDDLVEEVVRILGYDQIKSQPMVFKSTAVQSDKIRSLLVSSGLTEIISWSFVDSKNIELFAKNDQKLTLANPISEELNHMRPNLAMGLIDTYRKNVARNFSDLALFEIGNVFVGEDQKLMISGLRAGKNKDQSHYHDQRDFDVFDVKKDLLAILEIHGLRPESLQISHAESPKYYHPHRSAAVKLGKNIVGFFGELHPVINKKFALKNRVNLFEVFASSLPNSSKSLRRAYIQNDLPLVERDFAFLIERDLQVGDLVKTISSVDKQLIKEVSIFDIFTGHSIADDKKSVALRVKIEPQQKTLTSDEIEVISKKIIDSVILNHNASLR